MRIYLEFIKNTFQSNMAYRMNVSLRVVTRIIFMFIQVTVWTALYKGASNTGTLIGSVSLREMVTYTILSTGITILLGNNTVFVINKKIESGELAMDLIKPLNFKGFIFCGVLGDNLFRLIFEFIPILILGIWVFGLNYASPLNTLLYIIAMCNGILINFLISYCMGLLCFWYFSVYHLGNLTFQLIRLFSGSFIPLWFFPGGFYWAAMLLPFRLIYYSPISIYLGKYSVAHSVSVILLQIFWIVILQVAEKLLWRKGVEKIVVQGG